MNLIKKKKSKQSNLYGNSQEKQISKVETNQKKRLLKNWLEKN